MMIVIPPVATAEVVQANCVDNGTIVLITTDSEERVYAFFQISIFFGPMWDILYLKNTITPNDIDIRRIIEASWIHVNWSMGLLEINCIHRVYIMHFYLQEKLCDL